MPENEKIISELKRLGVSHMLVAPNSSGTIPVPDQVASLRAISEKFILKADYIA
jgi:hypothetical protein